MKIGIVGAGNVGRLYGERWVRGGHDVAFGYVRDRARLEALVAELGASATIVEVHDLAEGSDVIVFAPPFEQIEHAAALVGPAASTIVVDTTNPFTPERTSLVDLGGGTSSARVAALFPDALVVKALHNLSVQQVEASTAQAPAVMFVAGDDAGAKEMVRGLIVDAGLTAVDTGGLSTAGLSEAPGPLFMTVFDASTAAAALADAAV
jgi:predicted dinucleotide-binding enzyme